MNQLADYDVPEWPYAYGNPSGTGVIKTRPDDFIVDELLPFVPEGDGEHVFLQVEKSGENTEYVARLLARYAGVRQRDVGFAGLKDRHAVTTQWFSIWLPGVEGPDWKQLQAENISIKSICRHVRKLKRGVISENKFNILIRNWQGDPEETEKQLLKIRVHGFPNYFGLQRFGHQGRNVAKAMALFRGERYKRAQKSMYLSAARSWLYNQILAERVIQDNWNQLLSGDVCQLNQCKSVFAMTQPDTLLDQRVRKGDIHPTAVLWGGGDLETSAEAEAIEKSVLDRFPDLKKGLENFGLTTDRRSLRVLPDALHWKHCAEDSSWKISFSLPPGAYATSLLREVIRVGGE